MSTLNLAVVQSPGNPDSTEARLDWLAATLRDPAIAETDLLLLPELFTSGYNMGAAVTDRAEPRDGPSSRHIAALAARHDLAIAYGYPERTPEGIYNAAQCIGPDGPLTHHRKLAIPPGREQGHFLPGKGTALFGWRGVRIALLICYDIEFTEPARHVAGQGAELILVPTALSAEWPVVARSLIPTRAIENGAFIAYANHAGTEGDLTYLGESTVTGPDGRDLARAGAEPQVLTVRIDPEKVAAARARLPYLQDRHRLTLA